MTLIINIMENKNWDDIRIVRDYLLKSCDWTQLNDVDMDDEKKEMWKFYRKELRNITGRFRTPLDVIWPDPPQ